MPVKAWYDPVKDYYIMDFTDDPAFTLPEWAIGQEQQWSMFTHGVCAVVVGNPFMYHRIAITGAHLGGRTDAHLLERLEQASRKLHFMGQELTKLNPGSFQHHQCIQASEILTREQDDIIKDLLASYAQGHKEEQENV